MHTENEDYNSTISPGTATLTRNSPQHCHSVPINNDEYSEPRETFSVSITATGPSQEIINLFDITVPVTVVSIIDDDSELWKVLYVKVLSTTYPCFWIGVSVSFEREDYTVNEESGTLEVCLTFDGPLKSDSFVELQISLTSVSATGRFITATCTPPIPYAITITTQKMTTQIYQCPTALYH